MKEVREPVMGMSFQGQKAIKANPSGNKPATFKDQQGGDVAGAECPTGRELGDESERPVT